MPRSWRLAVAMLAVVIGGAIGYAIQNFIADTAPQVGGRFTMSDHTGKQVSDAAYRGKVMVVFFGFTNCPDICPTGLARMAEVMDALGPRAADVQPLFVTVDPGRDTPAVMKSYVEHFSDRIIGLTGTSEQVAAIAKAYRVYFKLHGDPATNPNYVVDHSGFVYVMDRSGRFVGTFNPDSSVDAAVKLIQRAL